MAEVPEHLLARSRARRAALGLGGGDAGETTAAPTSAEKPADQPAAASAPAAPAQAPVIIPEPEPQPPAAPPPRRRVPGFVVPVLAILPFWALLYAGTFGERHAGEEELTPFQLGQEIYTSAGCSGCHGGGGEGGVGPALDQVEQVFPEIADHIAWIRGGSQSVGIGNPYGDPAVGRVARGGMPAFSNLSDEEVEAVAVYEREAFGG